MTEGEADRVWKAAREAGVRSLYFGEMLFRHTRRKQWLRGASLGFTSGAAVFVIGGSLPEVGAALVALTAIVNVWAIFANLDQRVLALARLRTAWETLRIEYSALWSGLSGLLAGPPLTNDESGGRP